MITKKTSCDDCQVGTCLVKKNYIPTWNEICLNGKRIESVGSGFTVYPAGSTIDGMYFVQCGLVKEYVTTSNAKQSIVRFAGQGDVMGSAGLADEIYRTAANAHEESVICFFEKKWIYEMYLSNPQIAFDLMHYFSALYNDVSHRLKTIALMNLREKIAEGILYIAANFGVNKKNELNNRISREDLAGLACTTTQQVSRQLSEFEDEKLIGKRGRAIVLLNEEKLKEIIAKY